MSAEDFLQIAIQDHEILAQFIENVEKLFAGEPGTDAQEAMETIGLLLNKKILDHFAYEEDRVFPSLVTGPAKSTAARVVAELTKDHQTLREEARRLNQALAQPDLARGAGALRQALMDFVNHLQEHAAQEDELFHTVLETPG